MFSVSFFCLSHKRGFTLIEVILTMSLFTLIALFTSPFYGDFIFEQELPLVSRDLKGSLSKAQLYSMHSKNASSWGVKVEESTIILFCGDSFESRDTHFDQTFSIHPKITVSGLETPIIFAKTTGRPSITPRITLTGSDQTQTFRLTPEGVWQEQE